MSDTPRTDSGMEFDDSDLDSTRNFARQLERELDAANERIKRLEEESESRWHLAQSAIGSCAEMSSRIKRLEEAGDAMHHYCDAASRFVWKQTKKTKP